MDIQSSPSKVCRSFPDCRSYRLMIPSMEPEATIFPSGLCGGEEGEERRRGVTAACAHYTVHITRMHVANAACITKHKHTHHTCSQYSRTTLNGY